jgi:DNA polymerase-1
MLADVQPDAAAVVWDAGLPARRMELLPSYKQQRDETPDQLEAQFPVIEEAVAALGFHNVSLKGHEADDLIASYAAAVRAENPEVIIATNDKDIYSLVENHVSIYSTNKTDLKDPKDGFALLGPSEVEAKWGVPPGLIPDVLALTGDAVDNIPGVEGVGPKTAAKLVREHGAVSKLADDPSVIKNDKLRDKVAAAFGRRSPVAGRGERSGAAPRSPSRARSGATLRVSQSARRIRKARRRRRLQAGRIVLTRQLTALCDSL